jgi:hypothetical protein
LASVGVLEPIAPNLLEILGDNCVPSESVEEPAHFRCCDENTVRKVL